MLKAPSFATIRQWTRGRVSRTRLDVVSLACVRGCISGAFGVSAPMSFFRGSAFPLICRTSGHARCLCWHERDWESPQTAQYDDDHDNRDDDDDDDHEDSPSVSIRSGARFPAR